MEVEVCGVRFKRCGKIYYFDENGIKAEYFDPVVVEVEKGLEVGRVVEFKSLDEEDLPEEGLKKVIRICDENDFQRLEDNRFDAECAMAECQELAYDYTLPMEVVSASYTFDRSKLIFYFVAENRVDFRQLVKDLAAIYRVRIELRQIGVRDHAKMLKCYGICGQECCCSRFLSDFKSLSIKMAKDQDITLDPSKISGSCGRLMCCLAFESENYKKARESLPKKDSLVMTEDGEGRVLENDYVRERSKVRVKTGEDEEMVAYYEPDAMDF